MLLDIATGGTASASTIYGGGFEADKAFDKDNSGTRWNSDNAGYPQWIKYDLGSGNEEIVVSIRIYGVVYLGNAAIRAFKVQGSNDNSNWDDLTTTQEYPQTDVYYDVAFTNTTAYRYYRLYLTSSWTSFDSIYEIYLYIETSDIVEETDDVTISDEISVAGLINESGNETISLSDNLNISGLIREQINEATITITDTINQTLSIIYKYGTKLITALTKVYNYTTDLRVGISPSYKYATNLHTSSLTNKNYKTDLRVRNQNYASITIGTLNDYVVKLDGVELTDIDYDTLNLTYNFNSSPSRAEFTLARRFDNLDQKLNGSSSVITNENKIEIFDGVTKLFTGYIMELDPNSSSDTVKVIAEDVRSKFKNSSMELKYGGQFEQDEDDADKYTKFEKNIQSAYVEIMTAIGGLVSGYDSLPFPGSFVPEYSETYNDYASLLDAIILNTANVNWYIDENERLRFQKVGLGDIKTLKISSLTEQRHPYDLVISDITLNKRKQSYAKSLNVKRGKHLINKWNRRTFSGWLTDVPLFLSSLAEKVIFGFQQWGEVGQKFYVGINPVIYGYVDSHGWVLKPTLVVQWSNKETDEDLDDITVGSGSPKKTVFMTSYGIKETNTRWEERIKESNNKPYLCYVHDEAYDRTEFLQDLANFELNQNNKLQTDAQVSMLFDAYKYYNIKLSDQINISNTIQANIYNNNNGFPLNISGVNFDFKTRTVTLNLTNYGKSYYAKTKNFMSKYTSPSITYAYEKKEVVKFIQGI
jgi:hypothetical protein